MPSSASPARSRVRRALGAAVLVLAASYAAVPVARVRAQSVTAPPAVRQRLVVLSTTDVKGKTSPCGCHTPKGGFARRAAFADSVRAQAPDVLIVDNGGWFPEADGYQANAAFMAEAMADVGVRVAGVSGRELRFGRSFLYATVAHAKFPVVCANLEDRHGRSPIRRWVIDRVGGRKVGVFGLMTGDDLPERAADSLRVGDPAAAAREAVAALRRDGATVVVLLSSLGKVQTEDLVVAVDGIDLAVAGRDVPLLDRGRQLKSTAIVYGGEQGQYMGRAELGLDARGRVVEARTEAVMMGPAIGEEAATLAKVKAFEDGFNEQLRRVEKERAAAAVALAAPGDPGADHYVGADVCGRCHAAEYAQWKATPHARAWGTLVEHRVDARTDCVPCHVLGYRKPGGFQSGTDAERLANVQCESCHGMGTAHDAGGSMPRPAESTCRGCHDATASPQFDFALYEPHIRHRRPATLPALPPKPKTGMVERMGAAGH